MRILKSHKAEFGTLLDFLRIILLQKLKGAFGDIRKIKEDSILSPTMAKYYQQNHTVRF